MIQVVLPAHLQDLASVGRSVDLDIDRPATLGRLLDTLEAEYPALCGTVRDPATGRRRPFVRFFACEEDLSHQPPDMVLPEAVVSGVTPFFVVGAMAGG
ncbi:MAG: MoaD/ThiS family protein [Acidimicrobiales bacterium]